MGIKLEKGMGAEVRMEVEKEIERRWDGGGGGGRDGVRLGRLRAKEGCG